MFVHANIATVPAFAPVNEYADWYWAFLEPKPDMVLHPTCPLPEVVAWHREHFGDQPFDDFIPELTYERFDAGWYAQLLDDAGMRYAVLVSKHHDGFCWWDTAYTSRNSMELGPKRDVVRELADAVRAKGHVFGCYYSLLDWAHGEYPDQAAYVDAFMRPQIQELIARYDPAVLWGDGHWGHPGAHWRAEQIVADARAAGSAVLFNDRFFAPNPDFVTFEYDVPDTPPEVPWELCRGLSHSFCVNRAERDEDHLDAHGIVALLVETVAKGGNLLLNVGPNADGTLAAIQERVLRESGAWVRAHAEAIHGSTRFDEFGSGAQWYTRTGAIVHAFDLSSTAEPRFPALHGVTRIATPAGDELTFRETNDGIVVDARAVPRDPLGARYVVSCDTARPLRARTVAKTRIGELLAAARPGDVVDLPPGRYTDEQFPLTIPAGVTLRGVSAAKVVIDAGGRHGVVLAGTGATLEGITVTGGAPGYMMIPPTSVTGQGGDGLAVRDCHVQSIAFVGGSGHRITGNVIASGKVWLMGTNACEVHANFQHGLRWGVGIEVQGGDAHIISENELRDDLCAIKCVGTTGARVERNHYETRWVGIHLLDATDSTLYRNRAAHTMRAVNVEGGRANRVEKQLAERCDSGVMIEGAAAGTVVTECWLHDCRVGVMVWGAGDAELANVAVSAARDHAVVADRPLNLDHNELDGDVWIS
jgi:alpha-L-fucosidase